MDKAIKCGLALGALLGLGWVGYKWWQGETVSGDQSDDFDAAMKSSHFGEWVPQLPIHQRSKLSSTNATYKPVKVSTKYKDGIVPARDMDYYNPSQIVASTGPGNLAPFATGDTKELKAVKGR